MPRNYVCREVGPRTRQADMRYPAHGRCLPASMVEWLDCVALTPSRSSPVHYYVRAHVRLRILYAKSKIPKAGDILMENLLGAQLLSKSGTVATAQVLAGKNYVMIYFAGHL